MQCVACGCAADTERPERTAQGYRRFRCRYCGKQFNERSGTLLNRAQYPSDVIALVVLWRLRYKLALRDLPEMFALRGIVFSPQTVHDWEAKLTPSLAEGLRRRRHGKAGRSWHVDETYLKVDGRWCYLYRAIDRSGTPVDVLFSEHRDMKAARAFFRLWLGGHAGLVQAHPAQKETCSGSSPRIAAQPSDAARRSAKRCALYPASA